MKAEEVFKVMRDGMVAPDGVEKSAWNSNVFKGAQAATFAFMKWHKEQVKELTKGMKTPEYKIRMLEPMSAEEREKKLKLLMDEQIEDGNIAGLERLVMAVDKVYGLAGENKTVVEMVDFGSAWPDLEAARQVCSREMPVIETKSK